MAMTYKKPLSMLRSEARRAAIFPRLCAILRVSMEEVRGLPKHREIARVRRFMIRFLYDETSAGWSEIARLMHRDHSTIITGYKRINEEIEIYTDTRNEYLAFRQQAMIEALPPDAQHALTLIN